MKRLFTNYKTWIFSIIIAITIGFGIWTVLDWRRDHAPPPVDCASYIENLPADIRSDVNDACTTYIEAGLVTESVLTEWLECNRVAYVTSPFFFDPTILGYTRKVGIRTPYIELWVFDVRESPSIDFLHSMRRRVAFHEMGHIILMAAGYDGENLNLTHHAIMDAYEVCPDRCPGSVMNQEGI